MGPHVSFRGKQLGHVVVSDVTVGSQDSFRGKQLGHRIVSEVKSWVKF